MACYKIVLFFLVVYLSCAQCSKILIVFPMGFPSHDILGRSLVNGLTKAGHNVTYITAFQNKNVSDVSKYREIVVPGINEKLKAFKIATFETKMQLDVILQLQKVSEHLATWTLEDHNVQILLKSNETFDVVIVEELMIEATKILAYNFNASLITYSTLGANDLINYLVSNPSPKSYIPNVFLRFYSNMNFWQRLYNVLFTFLFDCVKHFIILPAQNDIVQKFFPGAPNLNDIIYNSSLLLLNSDLSSTQAMPMVPCMINVGGHHISPPKTLAQGLQSFLDDAKDGAIYFSMGSNLKSKDMSEKTVQSLLNVFKKLKQKVIWKWENESLPGKPDNVKIGKWLPQQDILAHPNIKLFITHGGLLSTTETIYHGVPVLAIPIFADQKVNAAQIVHNGYGLSLSFHDLQNEESFLKTINELLTNSQYIENAKKRSKIFHDRPIKPMDLAIFWIEYVIRHKGAPHLRVAGLGLPWYQYNLLDVFAFIFVCLVGLMYVVYVTIRRILRFLYPINKIQKQKKQ